MVKKMRTLSTGQDLIQSLLRQRAAEQSLSRRWNRYSLLVIYTILIAVVVMSLTGLNQYLTAAVAAAGLAFFWIYTFLHSQQLEKQFYREESEHYRQQFSVSAPENAGRPELAPLSEREMEVLCRIVRGSTNKDIARQLNISQQTAKNHITHILKKMEVTDRTSAAVMALRLGWIKPGPDGDFTIVKDRETHS